MHVVVELVEARAARGKERRYIMVRSVEGRLKHARGRQMDDLPKREAPEPLSEQVERTFRPVKELKIVCGHELRSKFHDNCRR